LASEKAKVPDKFIRSRYQTKRCNFGRKNMKVGKKKEENVKGKGGRKKGQRGK
jgi:hypothetical protein